jgi:diguanylate cyclase
MASDPSEEDGDEQEFARVLTVAKEALKYIGVFRTPPTPGVYDVWYRYVEGTDSALHEQLSHAVTVSKAVTKEQLEYFHQQKIAETVGAQSVEQVREKLSREIASLTSLISSQIDANEEFDAGIRAAQGTLGDFMPTPFMIRGCIEQLIKCNQKMHAQMTELQSGMKASQDQIDQLQESLLESQKAVLTDPLTSIGNRRSYDLAVKRALVSRDNHQSPLYMLLVDLDKLKLINDTFSHLVGDDVLKHVARVLKTVFPDASVARFGGDEFVVLSPLENPIQASEMANLLCQTLAGKELQSQRTGERLGQVTVSVGVAQLRSTDDERSWFERADKLMMSAKQSGGNRALVERELR